MPTRLFQARRFEEGLGAFCGTEKLERTLFYSSSTDFEIFGG
jgi:hypothetical protein